MGPGAGGREPGDPCACAAGDRAGQTGGVPAPRTPRRRTPVEDGRAALAAWCDGADDRTTTATAVRYTLEELGARHPGRSLEVRVPPFGAVQCVEGPVHTRGTPPSVVETDAATWLAVATGREQWNDVVAAGKVQASGLRSDLTDLLPLTEEAS